MIYFENGIDSRCREPVKPTVARVRVAPGDIRYCVVGTAYGFVHTAGGDVRTWRSYSGARRYVRVYTDA